LESLVFLSKKDAKWYKRLKDYAKQRPKKEETGNCHQKKCCRHHCTESTEGEQLISGTYQALLRKDMWPWISATYPD
jgi:hypothetical protein